MMVKQTRHIFDLTDVEALRFHCNGCGGEVLVEVLKYEMPDCCPLCKESWDDSGPAMGSGTAPTMGPSRLLARAIQDVLRAKNVPMTVRFEIDGA